SVIKSTAIDPSVVDADGIYRKRASARVFTSDKAAIAAIKGRSDVPVQAGDIVVLMCRGTLGTGLEVFFHMMSAFMHVKMGKLVKMKSNAYVSGVSICACTGRVVQGAPAGEPLEKIQYGDLIEIVIDTINFKRTMNFIGTTENMQTPEAGTIVMAKRPPRTYL